MLKIIRICLMFHLNLSMTSHGDGGTRRLIDLYFAYSFWTLICFRNALSVLRFVSVIGNAVDAIEMLRQNKLLAIPFEVKLLAIPFEVDIQLITETLHTFP